MLTISDDILKSAGLTEQEARIEFACMLFKADRIALPTAGRLAGLSRTEIENELMKRGIAPYTLTVEMLHEDLATLQEMFPNGTRSRK